MIARCTGCTQTRKHAARGLCWACYMDPKLRVFAPMRRAKYRRWTPEEVAILKRLRPTRMSLRELARYLPGRNENEIKQKSRRLRLCDNRGAPPRGRCSVCDVPAPLWCSRFGWKVRVGSLDEKWCPQCWRPDTYHDRPKDPARPVFVGHAQPRVHTVSRVAV